MTQPSETIAGTTFALKVTTYRRGGQTLERASFYVDGEKVTSDAFWSEKNQARYRERVAA